MKDYILNQVARMRHDRHLQEGLRLRHCRSGRKLRGVGGLKRGLLLESRPTSGSSKAYAYENRIRSDELMKKFKLDQ